MTVDKPTVYQDSGNGFVSSRILSARKKMYDIVFSVVAPDESILVLDVGVTADKRHVVSNIFEEVYPYPENITAAGIEDCTFLEDKYPGLVFRRIKPNQPLPFAKDEFDFVLSYAVIEHVGLEDEQKYFINELLRVGKITCIITPNLYFPVEMHVWLPLVHWLPRTTFQSLIKQMGYKYYGEPGNLSLLSEQSLKRLYPADISVTVKRYRTFGITSHLIAFSGL